MKGDGGVMTWSSTSCARHALARATARRRAGAEAREKSVGCRMRWKAVMASLEGGEVGGERPGIRLGHLDLRHVRPRLLLLGVAQPLAQVTLRVLRAHVRKIVRDGCAHLADRVAAVASLLGEQAIALRSERGTRFPPPRPRPPGPPRPPPGRPPRRPPPPPPPPSRPAPTRS